MLRNSSHVCSVCDFGRILFSDPWASELLQNPWLRREGHRRQQLLPRVPHPLVTALMCNESMQCNLWQVPRRSRIALAELKKIASLTSGQDNDVCRMLFGMWILALRSCANCSSLKTISQTPHSLWHSASWPQEQLLQQKDSDQRPASSEKG